VTKPFDTEVLLCKIKAVLKRQDGVPSTESRNFQIGQYHFDYTLREITFKEEPRKISPKEADLLKLLCEHKNELLSRETALNKIWGEDGYFTARNMDVFITKLRKYLSGDPAIEIRNVHGSGFLLSVLIFTASPKLALFKLNPDLHCFLKIKSKI